MRPGSLLAFAAVLASALLVALFGPGNAKAWNLSAQDTSFGYSVHLDDNTIPAGIACPTLDPSGVCGQVPFTVTTAGTVTATGNFPIDSQVDLTLCQTQSPDLTVDNCPRGTEIVCTKDQVANADGTSFQQTIMCPVSGGQFELLVVPVFVATCPVPGDPDFDPLHACLGGGPGIDVTGMMTFAAGGGTVGTTFVAAKVKGSGEVGPQQHFTLKAKSDPKQWDAKHAEGKVQYKDDHVCKFRSKYFTLVQITYDSVNESGTAHIEGKGYVNNSTTLVDFTTDAVDGGPKQADGDQFKLIAPGCSNSSTAVVKGSIEIKPAHMGHDDD